MWLSAGGAAHDPVVLALLVIPSLKLSDCGLFDGNKFQFVDLFVETDVPHIMKQTRLGS